MCVKYSGSCDRLGMTLVEVIVALALLSTLLVAVLVAFTKNAERIRAGLATQRAAMAADELLYDWAKRGVSPPPHGEGDVPGLEGYQWETRVLSHKLRDSLGLDIVQLRVRANGESNHRDPLVALDLPVRVMAASVEGDTRP